MFIAQEVAPIVPAAGSSAVWIAMIGAISSLATVVVTYLMTSRKQDKAAEEQKEQKVAIQQVHEMTNDRLTKIDDRLQASEKRLAVAQARIAVLDAVATENRDEIIMLKAALVTEKRRPKVKK